MASLKTSELPMSVDKFADFKVFMFGCVKD